MTRRFALVVPVFILALALAVALVYWRGRGGEDAIEQAHEAGLDVGAERGPGTGFVYIPDQRETLPSGEYLESLRRAIEEDYHRGEAARLAEEETQRRAAEAEAAARANDDAYAARVVREWGAGQLLLGLPSIGVSASVSQLGFLPGTQNPATPTSPWGVGWYTFTDYPGGGGNAVVSGHVDWFTGAPAVFGRLRAVGVGDPLYMILADGTPLTYVVERSDWVTPYTADVGEIFGITSRDAVTVITCGGAWDPVARDYSHRLVVRAYRVR